MALIVGYFRRFSVLRLLQMAFALFCLGDFFFYSGQYVVLFLGLVVLAQAVFNWQLGCANGSCNLPESYK